MPIVPGLGDAEIGTGPNGGRLTGGEFSVASRRALNAASLEVLGERRLGELLAGFVNLAALGLEKPGPFAPFIDAGIGAAQFRIVKTSMTFPVRSTTVAGGNRTGLAWMATARVAVVPSARVTLDPAWCCSDLGEVRTPLGPGRVVWRDGSREPPAVDLAPMKARLPGRCVRMSLRDAF